MTKRSQIISKCSLYLICCWRKIRSGYHTIRISSFYNWIIGYCNCNCKSGHGSDIIIIRFFSRINNFCDIFSSNTFFNILTISSLFSRNSSNSFVNIFSISSSSLFSATINTTNMEFWIFLNHIIGESEKWTIIIFTSSSSIRLV